MNNWQTMLFSAQGRIRRSQYWLWAIGCGVILGILFSLDMMIFAGSAATTGHMSPLFWVVYVVILAVGLFTGINLQIKRWHDRDKSGWWILIGLIPVIGGIWALIECGFLDGTPGPNKFGPSPKGLGNAASAF